MPPIPPQLPSKTTCFAPRSQKERLFAHRAHATRFSQTRLPADTVQLTDAVSVQIGMSFDGKSAISDAFARKGFRRVLVEGQVVLNHFESTGSNLAEQFDHVIAIARTPGQSDEQYAADAIAKLTQAKIVDAATHGAGTVIFPGQEASVAAAQKIAAHFAQSLPNALTRASNVEHPSFTAPGKIEQRALIDAYNDDPRALCEKLAQPAWHAIGNREDAHFETALYEAVQKVGYPAVLKPSNGGGGLGIFTLRKEADLNRALAGTAPGGVPLRNYGGGLLHGYLVEKMLPGREHSLQGTVANGRLFVHSTCAKIVAIDGGRFHEIGHIAQRPSSRDAFQLSRMAQQFVDAVGYKDGPLQIDFVENKSGKKYLLEAGFRLSGMGVRHLTDAVSGVSWADEAASAYIGGHVRDTSVAQTATVATLALRSLRQLKFAKAWRSTRLSQFAYRVTCTKLLPPGTADKPELQPLAMQFGSQCGSVRISAAESGQATLQAICEIMIDIACIGSGKPKFKPL